MPSAPVIKKKTPIGRRTRSSELSGEVVVFCPGCKALQTFWFTGYGLMQTIISFLEDLSFRQVKSRVGRVLLEHAGGGITGRPHLSQREMAALTGTTWELVSRSLKSLQEEGAIRIDRHRIIINKESLEKVLEWRGPYKGKEVKVGLSIKYGKVDVPGIGGDEPVFILRAQDKLAEAAIQMYRILAASHGSKLAESLDKEIESFRNWQGHRKLPD